MAAHSMSDPDFQDDLLATKLVIPLVSQSIVPRRRLTDILKMGMERRLTLVTAPTGYGKTTLLAEWLSGILLQDWRVIWVTIDSYDNEPFRLWSYIAAALRKAYPRLRFDPQRWFRDPSDDSRFVALTQFINAITQIPFQIVLVLDDYQWITAEKVHQEVRFLLDHQPQNLHLLISSRVTPPFPLSRLRAQRQMVEVTAKDLSFTLQEANSYFSSVMKLDIDQDQATALHVATEGWIAGLQLATLSLQGRLDRQSFINSLPLGGNRQIYEYLTEEVLDQQDPEVRDFLLKTSILSEFSAPLCDAMLERSDSREMLNEVLQANLFVVPRDEHQHWYSYHRLFADTLQSYLKDTYPEIIPGLHHKACIWLQENGYPEKAVAHALADGDLEQAAKIIDACAMQAVIGFDLVQLSQWIGRFSDDLIIKRPQLAVYYALANYLLERFDNVEPKLKALEQILGKSRENGLPTEDEAFIRWEIAAIRECVNCYRGNAGSVSTIFTLIRNAPEKDVYFTGLMLHALGEGHALQGNLSAAIDSYTEGCRYAIDHRLILEYCYSQTELAFVRKMQGKLHDTESDYLNLIDYVYRYSLPCDLAAFGKAGLAEIALEKNQLVEAGEQIRWIIDNFDRIEICPLTWVRPEWLYVRLAKYYLALQDYQNAFTFFERAIHGFRANRQVVPYLSSLLIDTQVKIWSVTGELNAKNFRIQEQLAFLNTLGESNPALLAAQVRYALAQADPEKALSLLTQWIPELEASGMNERLLEAKVLQALAYQATDDCAQALQSLHRALQIALPEGYRRVFTEAGSPMKALLEQYCQQPTNEDQNSEELTVNLATSLISELEQQGNSPTTPLMDTHSATNLVYPISEPLSRRELEIMHYMVEGKSPKEIAVAMSVSVNTLKVHIRSLYRKIGAHSRAALLQRARDLGLTNDPPQRSD